MICGIDPGNRGAIVLISLSGEALEAVEMPDSVWAIGDEIDRLKPAFIVVEKAQAMPKNGVVAMFNYGVHFGMIQGAIAALNIPFTLLEPRRWTKAMHVGCTGDSAKERSLMACRRLFPRFNVNRGVKKMRPHDGIVDALLIAEYARRHLYGRPQETEIGPGSMPEDG